MKHGTIKSIFNSIIGAFPPNPVSICLGAALDLIIGLVMQIIGHRTTSDYEDINTLDDWKKLIELKSNKLKDINELLNNLYTLSDPNNEILKLKLQPNSAFVNQYKYVVEFKAKQVATNDIVLFILLLDITLALLIFMILKSKRKNY